MFLQKKFWARFIFLVKIWIFRQNFEQNLCFSEIYIVGKILDL